jgi:hypothetical protein
LIGEWFLSVSRGDDIFIIFLRDKTFLNYSVTTFERLEYLSIRQDEARNLIGGFAAVFTPLY